MRPRRETTSGGTDAQAQLIERIRDLLTGQPVMREVAMFGVRAFMVNDKVLVGARKDGGLLVRVAAERHDELLLRQGAEQAEMGPGRSMGPGWIEVTASSIDDADALASWIEVALDHNATDTGTER